MIHNQIIILFISFFVLNSCSPESERKVKYYSNGQIKWEVELLDGKRNGVLKEYYEDGVLMSKGNWENGLADGKTEYYYKNGLLKSLSFWRNGKQEGVTKKYYRNGRLKSVAVYKDDQPVNINYFDKQSRLFEKQIYDDLNQLVYLAKFDTLGYKEYGFPLALFNPDKDTVKLGETYKVKIYFGLPLKGDVRAYTGKFKEETLDFMDSVELEEVKPFVFQYKYKPEKAGSHSIPFKFEHETNASDTLNVDGLRVKHGIFVIDDRVEF